MTRYDRGRTLRRPTPHRLPSYPGPAVTWSDPHLSFQQTKQFLFSLYFRSPSSSRLQCLILFHLVRSLTLLFLSLFVSNLTLSSSSPPTPLPWSLVHVTSTVNCQTLDLESYDPCVPIEKIHLVSNGGPTPILFHLSNPSKNLLGLVRSSVDVLWGYY